MYGDGPWGDLRETHANAFRDAWDEFTATCADTVAPVATYQAWLAHLMIQRVGLMHVVREVDFGARHLDPATRDYFHCANLTVDLLVLREPVVRLPRRVALVDPTLPEGAPNPRSGLGRVGDFSVIVELQVAATQTDDLDHGEVVRDFRKLSAILDAAERCYPPRPLPAAFVGVLVNKERSRFSFERLAARLAGPPIRRDITLLSFDRATAVTDI